MEHPKSKDKGPPWPRGENTQNPGGHEVMLGAFRRHDPQHQASAWHWMSPKILEAHLGVEKGSLQPRRPHSAKPETECQGGTEPCQTRGDSGDGAPTRPPRSSGQQQETRPLESGEHPMRDGMRPGRGDGTLTGQRRREFPGTTRTSGRESSCRRRKKVPGVTLPRKMKMGPLAYPRLLAKMRAVL